MTLITVYIHIWVPSVYEARWITVVKRVRSEFVREQPLMEMNIYGFIFLYAICCTKQKCLQHTWPPPPHCIQFMIYYFVWYFWSKIMFSCINKYFSYNFYYMKLEISFPQGPSVATSQCLQAGQFHKMKTIKFDNSHSKCLNILFRYIKSSK
jgi:hypothetical protein